MGHAPEGMRGICQKPERGRIRRPSASHRRPLESALLATISDHIRLRQQRAQATLLCEPPSVASRRPKHALPGCPAYPGPLRFLFSSLRFVAWILSFEGRLLVTQKRAVERSTALQRWNPARLLVTTGIQSPRTARRDAWYDPHRQERPDHKLVNCTGSRDTRLVTKTWCVRSKL